MRRFRANIWFAQGWINLDANNATALGLLPTGDSANKYLSTTVDYSSTHACQLETIHRVT